MTEICAWPHFPLHPYDPNRFVDPEGYRAKIQHYEKLYQDRLYKERQN